ncbi:MAG: hypothetical protein H6712_06390 [Myxococcales bacterium]|nr:hypothetical protein [Myxococcales bacterium]MCB9713463.1 hypothetical protein [Myxococcales bacterium]
MIDLRQRSVRTLAWLGDVEFEREVRFRLARRGDFSTDRLDSMKSRIVRAEAQARLLERILPELRADELALVQRGRNAAPPAARRGKGRSTREYRAATGLEALIAGWCIDEVSGRARFDALLGPLLDEAITDALAADARRPRRG